MYFKYASGSYKREWGDVDLTGYELLIDLPGTDVTVTIYSKPVGSEAKPYHTYAAIELIAGHQETIIMDDFGALSGFLTGIIPLINAFPAEPIPIPEQPEPEPVEIEPEPEPDPISEPEPTPEPEPEPEPEQPEVISLPEKPKGILQKLFRRN